jgi:cysteine desulfurase
MTPIYLDYAATTPVDPIIMAEFVRISQDIWANPSSTHQAGQKARAVLEQARYRVAQTLNTTPSQIIFTSTATEANNIVIQSVADFYGNQGIKPHVLISSLEHSSVADFEHFTHADVEVFPVAVNGIADIDNIISKIRPETVLISLMLANNEIGTIQPVPELVNEISTINRERTLTNLPPIRIQTDAVQTPLWIPLDLEKLSVDFLVLSGHKMYAPKGCGVLYIRDTNDMGQVVFGGSQERGIRSGTQNLAAVHATSLALETAQNQVESAVKEMKLLQTYGLEQIAKYIPSAILNGDLHTRLPNNIHITLPGLDRDIILTKLDLAGIYVSSGSSCGSGSNQRSDIMTAIGNTVQGADIRISMGRGTTKNELDLAVQYILSVSKK